MNCTGVDLVNPVDRMPPGAFPYLNNVRVIEEGRLESRPGYTAFSAPATATKLLHSIRRLNDQDATIAPSGYTYIVGNGTTLMSGIESALLQIDAGYSGNPLSLLTFRPDQSPQSWMYVYDSNKLVKVNAAGTIRPTGVAPPTVAPDIEYGAPASASVVRGQSASGWGVSGASSGISAVDRTAGIAFTVASILYNSGTTGWCCISPSAGDLYWAGERMKIILSGGPEEVLVREMHPAITTTTLAGIKYDSGTTGLCSLVFANPPDGLDRNSLININGEIVRVLAVVLSPDGTTYSVRCSATSTHAAGDAVAGVISWYCYTTGTHAAAETITSNYLVVVQSGAGAGAAATKTTENSSNANGRPIDPANDYLHISIFLSDPANVVELDLLVDVDPATTAGTAFTDNFWQWTIPQATLGSFTAGSTSVWLELVIPISQGVRHGSNLGLGFSTVFAVGVALTTTGPCNYGFDWWYFFGTYGPLVQPNAPTGVFYESRFRDSTTGAASVPGPVNLYQLFPLRELVLVTPQATSQTGVDSIDIYRDGGTLSTFAFVGSVADNAITPVVFQDRYSDTAVETQPAPDLTLFQPFVTLALPVSGVVSVVGTTVTWVSGAPFPVSLLNATIILIAGVTYLTYGQPTSATSLQITQSAGVQSNVAFLIASPQLAGQALPFAFGPLEGPLAPVVFALGDDINAGTLYWANTNNADGMSDQNTLELCPPSEPLIAGAVWNGLVLAGSRDNVYLVRYAYLQTSQYQFNRIPSASGFWSRWAVCRGPNGVYALGRDGIYLFNESQGQCISDEQLYPLFPHDGQPGAGANGLLPVDMASLDRLRLTPGDRDIYFDYLDSSGAACTLRYEIARKRWFPHTYANAPVVHYLDEAEVTQPNDMQLLSLGASTGFIYKSGGDTDAGAPITTTIQLPCYDGGDERAQNLIVDVMSDVDGAGTISAALTYNNLTQAILTDTLHVAGVRIQPLTNVGSLANLALSQNMSMRYSWTGGPSGPRLYAMEPSSYVMPYLSTSIVTQFTNLNYQGWKHGRRLYPGIISTADVVFSIWTDDGRKYGPYTISSTGGRYRIVPQMLDQNIKALAFAFQVTSTAPFAFFSDSFTLEVKQWVEPDYLAFGIFRG